MTALSSVMSYAKKIRSGFFGFEDHAKIRNKYPLYWLAPAVNHRVLRIKVGGLLKNTPKPGLGNKTINFPIKTGVLKYLLPLLRLDTCRKKPVAIHIARLEGNLFVEKGLIKLRLAVLLNLDYVIVSLREYDYPSLRKRMYIHRGAGIDVAGVARINGSGYDYYGISPAHVEVLTRSHMVPLSGQVLSTAQESEQLP